MKIKGNPLSDAEYQINGKAVSADKFFKSVAQDLVEKPKSSKNSTKSISKTFEKESCPGELLDFLMDNIECTDFEVITNTPPNLDVVTTTNHKYTITIQKKES